MNVPSPMPWFIDEDNTRRLRVVDARGETVYEEDWAFPDEMSGATVEMIISRARANARFMVYASTHCAIEQDSGLLTWLQKNPPVLDEKIAPSVSAIMTHFQAAQAGEVAATFAVLLAMLERAQRGVIRDIMGLAGLLLLRDDHHPLN